MSKTPPKALNPWPPLAPTDGETNFEPPRPLFHGSVVHTTQNGEGAMARLRKKTRT